MAESAPTFRLTRRMALAAGAGLLSPALFGCAHAQHGRPQSQADRLRAALHYAFPIFEFARTGWVAAAPNPRRPAHRFNQLVHRRVLATPEDRNITTPNNDTVYSSVRFDLSNGPALIELPSVRDRYFSSVYLDHYTDHFAYIGPRATKGEGGVFLLAGPSWNDAAKAGAQLIKAPTNDVWMLARVLVTGPEDLPTATAIQDRIKILSAPEPKLPTIAPTRAQDCANLLAVVNEWLGRSPLAEPVGRRAGGFGDLGIRPGDVAAWTSLTPQLQADWQAMAAAELAIMAQGGVLQSDVVNNWRYPADGIGAPGARDDIRATVALVGFGAMERVEASYVRAQSDDRGETFAGDRRYRLMVPADVPADAFWSLSMYEIDADGRLFFAENAIARYSLGDRTPGLVRAANGAVLVIMQSDPPAEGAGNWLPTPRGPFAILFRLYIPQTRFLRGEWRLPAVERLAA